MKWDGKRQESLPERIHPVDENGSLDFGTLHRGIVVVCFGILTAYYRVSKIETDPNAPLSKNETDPKSSS